VGCIQIGWGGSRAIHVQAPARKKAKVSPKTILVYLNYEVVLGT